MPKASKNKRRKAKSEKAKSKKSTCSEPGKGSKKYKSFKKSKGGKLSETDQKLREFTSHLSELGFMLKEIEADGNCLFRALADQYENNQNRHREYRERIVAYEKEHREHFEPFMEDDEKFDQYCERMARDGAWGGNQELTAASMLFNVEIIVHQLGLPRIAIRPDQRNDVRATKTLHLAYDGELHYDSVHRDESDGEKKGRDISEEEKLLRAMPWLQLEDVHRARELHGSDEQRLTEQLLTLKPEAWDPKTPDCAEKSNVSGKDKKHKKDKWKHKRRVMSEEECHSPSLGLQSLTI